MATAMTATAGAGIRSPLAAAAVPPAAATASAPTTTTAARPAGGAATGTNNPFVSAGVASASTTTAIMGEGAGREARGPLPPAPPATGPSSSGGVLGSMRALYGYSPAKHDELELQAGDVVTVLERHVSGVGCWTRVRDSAPRLRWRACWQPCMLSRASTCRATAGARASTRARTRRDTSPQTTQRLCDGGRAGMMVGTGHGGDGTEFTATTMTEAVGWHNPAEFARGRQSVGYLPGKCVWRHAIGHCVATAAPNSAAPPRGRRLLQLRPQAWWWWPVAWGAQQESTRTATLQAWKSVQGQIRGQARTHWRPGTRSDALRQTVTLRRTAAVMRRERLAHRGAESRHRY